MSAGHEPAPDASSDDTGSPPPGAHPPVGIRIEVVRGGALDARRTAALTVAIAARTAAGGAPEHDGRDHAWARAARVEGVGRPRIDRPSDLDQPD